MLQDFQYILNNTFTAGEVIENIAVALVCSLIISLFYRFTYRGQGFAVSFVNSLIILCLITSVVIMVIGNNLARAFGLVGAMSIIRFRTAVKETLDIIYIFFALAIGLAAGVGYHTLAFIGTLFICFVIFLLTKTNIIAPVKQEYLLQFTYSTSNGSSDASYLETLKNYCKSSKLLNVRSLGREGEIELSYYVNLRNKKMSTEFIKNLRSSEGVNQVNLFFDEEKF